MKVRFRNIIALLLALVMMVCMAACGNKTDDAAAAGSDSEAQTEEMADAGEGENAEDGQAAEPENHGEVVKTIEGIDDPETIGPRIPLMIDSITLYEDGAVAIVPTEDLKKNEIKDDAEVVYPFEESGEVSDVYVVDYGNGGYRTIAAVLKDGTVSIVNGRALVEDHIFAVIDNVGNRENITEIENRTEEDGSYIVAITEDGREVILDYSINFDEPD